MKVLLDSNVWRYLVDQNASAALEKCITESDIQIVVTPSLVFETFELLNEPLRKSILKLQALPSWTRLMPDTFLEMEEIKASIRRYRPEWIVNNPDMTEVNQLLRDWTASDSGFWARAGDDIAPPTTDESIRQDRELHLTRLESQEIRAKLLSRGQTLPKVSLCDVYGIPPASIPGWLGAPVEYWRVPSLHVIWNELQIYASPYREWIDTEVDINAIFESQDKFTEMWYYQISAQDAPRQWLRGSFEYLQAYHKVTSGNPVDSQLASNLIDVDLIVSADRNFITFVEKCKKDAPFFVADPYRIAGGTNGVKDLLVKLYSLY